MKKIIGTLLIGSLMYVMPTSAWASSFSETEKQVDRAAKASTILHEKYIHNLDYKTMIDAPYDKARYEVAKAKSMVNSLPASKKKNQLLNRVSGYQKVVNNGNAYNNAVRTFPILQDYKKSSLDHYLSDGYFYGWRSYNYFNYKLGLLQKNYDKVYGENIQQTFKERYLAPIKKSRDDVYYLISASRHLNLAEASVKKNTDDTQRHLDNATACLIKVSDSKRKELLEEQFRLLQNLLEDRISGEYDTFYITKKSFSRMFWTNQFSMKISHNLQGENMRLWIADAKKYPSYESLKTAYGNQVYGHYSSNDSNGWISTFYWTYRDWSDAYQTNIVHGYWDSYLNPINEGNEKLLPPGSEIRVVLEVQQEDGQVVVKEEVITMTEELYQKALVD